MRGITIQPFLSRVSVKLVHRLELGNGRNVVGSDIFLGFLPFVSLARIPFTVEAKKLTRTEIREKKHKRIRTKVGYLDSPIHLVLL
jgi:hypothetical protein